MANSESQSTSVSKSEFKRLLLIGIQIRTFFDELTDESDEVKEKFITMVEEKYIKSFNFYAMKSGKAYAELDINIDWEEHQHQMDIGHLTIKTKSPDGILSPTKNVLQRFCAYVENNNFEIIWHFSYADHVNREEARKQFDTSSADKVEFCEDDYECRQYDVMNLTELSYTVKI